VDVRTLHRLRCFWATLGKHGTTGVKRFTVSCIALALSGCMTAQERQAQAIQNMDASDNVYCRKQADGTATYDQCRKNLMQLRQAA
jgi:hypothetical protein